MKKTSNKNGFGITETAIIVLIVCFLVIGILIIKNDITRTDTISGANIPTPIIGQVYAVTAVDYSANVVVAIPLDKYYVTNTLNRVMVKVNNDLILVGDKFIRQDDGSDVVIDVKPNTNAEVEKK